MYPHNDFNDIPEHALAPGDRPQKLDRFLQPCRQEFLGLRRDVIFLKDSPVFFVDVDRREVFLVDEYFQLAVLFLDDDVRDDVVRPFHGVILPRPRVHGRDLLDTGLDLVDGSFQFFGDQFIFSFSHIIKMPFNDLAQ